MLLQTWGEVFSSSLQNLWLGFMGFVPNLVIAIIVFVIGWVLGSIVSKALSQVIGALKIDRFFQSVGTENLLNKAGFKLNVGGFIGELVRWFIVIVFLVTSLEVMGLNQVNDFLKEFVLSYIPQVIIAAFILILATIVSDFMRKVVMGTSKAANVRSSKFLGTATYYSIWIFAFIIALAQLGIAVQFMQIIFTGIVAMFAIAGGLAFGLGGKDVAARSLEKMKNEMTADNQ